MKMFPPPPHPKTVPTALFSVYFHWNDNGEKIH